MGITKPILITAAAVCIMACNSKTPTKETPHSSSPVPIESNYTAASPSFDKENEAFEPIITSDKLNIYAIKQCGAKPLSNSSNIVLLDNNTPIDGDAWNHVDKANIWTGLTQPTETYNIQRQVNGQDSTCNNVPTYNNILVKKYGNWHQQHANGYFLDNEQDITFERLDTVIMDLFYDSNLSTLPSAEQLAKTYTDLTNEQLAEWDEGIFQLKVQLTDTTGNYHGAFNLGLTTDMADKWLRVEVPVSELTIWRTEGYTKFDITQSDIADKTLQRVGLVAETKNLKVFRNYNPESFNKDTTPKLFKEIAFRVKRLEITTKQN